MIVQPHYLTKPPQSVTLAAKEHMLRYAVHLSFELYYIKCRYIERK